MSQEGTSGGREDDQVLVAEYALGLLEGGERAALARRLATEPALASDLRLWRSRLATLDTEFAEVTAPAGVLSRVESRLFASAAERPGGWWNSLALWRGLTAAAAAVAIVAVGVNLMQPRVDPNVLATQLVAAIQAQEGSGIEFVALYDQASGEVRITSLRGDAVPNKDFELWYIKGEQPAVSMGVIPVNERMESRSTLPPKQISSRALSSR